MDPSGRIVQELSTDSVEGQPLSPDARGRAAIHTLDKRGEDSRVGIGRAGGEKNGVRMPGNAGNGTPDRLLQVLRHPPVILLLEVADGDDAVARTNCELGLGGGPADKGGGSGNPEEDEGRLVSVRRRLPH